MNRILKFNSMSALIAIVAFTLFIPIHSFCQTFTLGSTKDEVRSAQGTPDNINSYPKIGEVWNYGTSSVTFDPDTHRVSKWFNYHHQLKLSLKPKGAISKSSTFTIGSTKDEVLSVQGPPDSIAKYPNGDVWDYGYSSVTFDPDTQRVSKWFNYRLKVSLKPRGAISKSSIFTFTVGSTKDDVRSVQGTPSSITRYPDGEVWNYGYSSVTFDPDTHRVSKWFNYRLKVSLKPQGAISKSSTFTIGSTKDEVISVQGTPDSIAKYPNGEVWDYGSSSVTFDPDTQRVSKWFNYHHQHLKVSLKPKGAISKCSTFTIGSTKDEVLSVQGTPDSIAKFPNGEVWNYGYSSVTFDPDTQRVSKWFNYRLKVSLKPQGAISKSSTFTLGSTKDDVRSVQGTPISITKYPDGEVWDYGSSSVTFDPDTQRVSKWFNYQLKVSLPDIKKKTIP